MAVPRAARSEHAQTGKIAIAKKSASPHDQRIHDGRADTGYFGQGATYLGRWHIKNFGFVRRHTRRPQDRRSLQHADVGEKIALMTSSQKQFGPVALFE